MPLTCPFCHAPVHWRLIDTPWANDGGMSKSRRLGCDNPDCLYRPSAHYPTEKWVQGKGHIPQNLDAAYEAAWRGEK